VTVVWAGGRRGCRATRGAASLGAWWFEHEGSRQRVAFKDAKDEACMPGAPPFAAGGPAPAYTSGPAARGTVAHSIRTNPALLLRPSLRRSWRAFSCTPATVREGADSPATRPLLPLVRYLCIFMCARVCICMCKCMCACVAEQLGRDSMLAALNHLCMLH